MEHRRVAIESVLVHRGRGIHIRAKVNESTTDLEVAVFRGNVKQRRPDQWCEG